MPTTALILITALTIVIAAVSAPISVAMSTEIQAARAKLAAWGPLAVASDVLWFGIIPVPLPHPGVVRRHAGQPVDGRRRPGRGASRVTASPALSVATTVPPIMTRPDLLAPGEPWSHRCPQIITGTDRAGRVRTLPCAITTQGGRAGLAAHQAVVHGIG